VIISGTAAIDFFGDTLENFGDTQMCRNTRIEKYCSTVTKKTTDLTFLTQQSFIWNSIRYFIVAYQSAWTRKALRSPCREPKA
jgi:hypothetical protein